MQRDAIERASTARGDKVERWYSDTRTGATMQRSDLDELRRSAREGRIRKLYVYRLDRLTRSGIRDTLTLVEELGKAGCELVTVADGFDLYGPAAEVVLAVMAWAAQIERQAIAERVHAARANVEAKGGAWGRPRRVDERLLDRARVMRTKGRSIRAIAVALKIPRATLAVALKRTDEKPSRKPPTKNEQLRPGKIRGKRGAAR